MNPFTILCYSCLSVSSVVVTSSVVYGLSEDKSIIYLSDGTQFKESQLSKEALEVLNSKDKHVASCSNEWWKANRDYCKYF